MRRELVSEWPLKGDARHMSVYLPIAELPIFIPLYLALGAAVGVLSGLFGVGGGFLLTPLLIFLGIPPAVAVGTSAAHIVATSVSGAVTQYRRNNVDLRMGLVLLLGGVVGTGIGVEAVRLLRRAGVFDVAVSLSYVTFLGAVGTLMMIESVGALRAREKAPAAVRAAAAPTTVRSTACRSRCAFRAPSSMSRRFRRPSSACSSAPCRA